MGSHSTGIAIALAIGIPTILAICVGIYFYRKGRKRFLKEDLEFDKDQHISNINDDLSYDNLNELQLKDQKEDNIKLDDSTNSDTSETITIPKNSKQIKRYVPAYRQKYQSSIINSTTSINNNSRNSSYSNLNNSEQKNPIINSNSSINSHNSQITQQGELNFSDYNIPSDLNDISKSLKQSIPLYNGKRSKSFDSNKQELNPTQDDDHHNNIQPYDLQNNYNVNDEFEIKEEDQYENEFTNYEENKRDYINQLRPKKN
ncbi:hypothetical protein WICMUC_002851 [Wickerhamomyces mucosus]|uniref:Suppressor of lethality of KEX2 GAS1 double null mutant protein 1 n=1 Tax=Wickerhamomyces mucosus TaxID=1378264 RepID=A0A9P8TDR2_9ASCO|nr:hypothetical protein WICMUC_002851 [Wickerhamomyces mucosus]